MDQATLGLFGSFGALILMGYIFTIYKVIKNQEKNIWGNVKNGNLKKFYIFMIALSFVFGAYLVYFFTTSPGLKELLYPGLCLLLVFSAFWAWFPHAFSPLVLFGVSAGALILLVNSGLQLSKNKSPKVIAGLVGCLVLFIQTFFFDFLIWNGFVPKYITG